jgi:hypothetical protein
MALQRCNHKKGQVLGRTALNIENPFDTFQRVFFSYLPILKNLRTASQKADQIPPIGTNLYIGLYKARQFKAYE